MPVGVFTLVNRPAYEFLDVWRLSLVRSVHWLPGLKEAGVEINRIYVCLDCPGRLLGLLHKAAKLGFIHLIHFLAMIPGPITPYNCRRAQA